MNCSDRYIGCHDSCSLYGDWSNELKLDNEWMKQERDKCRASYIPNYKYSDKNFHKSHDPYKMDKERRERHENTR